MQTLSKIFEFFAEAGRVAAVEGRNLGRRILKLVNRHVPGESGAAVDKLVPPGFALGEEVIVDQDKNTVTGHLYIGEQVVVMLAKKDKKHVVLKAQPRGLKNIQVLNERYKLLEIHNMGLNLPMQQYLGYQYLRDQSKYGKDWYVLATTYEGKTLRYYADENGKHSSLRNTLLSVYQLLDILDGLHHKGQIVHRDIKQENLCFEEKIRVIDFGTAESLLHPNGEPNTENQALEGTLRYMSPGVHKENPLDPYDDLWSMLYMLLEMLMGKLPWHDAPEKNMLHCKTAYVEQYFVRQDATPPPGMDKNLHRCLCNLFKHVHNPPMADRVRNYNLQKLIIEQAWTTAGLKPDISRASFELWD